MVTLTMCLISCSSAGNRPIYPQRNSNLCHMISCDKDVHPMPINRDRFHR